MEAGLRPTGPERLPVLGETAVQGLIMASGGHSYGILLSPIVAQTITQLIMSGQTPALIQPFTLAAIKEWVQD
jgi:glycine oxidase